MADGEITIITTIHPAKNGKRHVTVAAAPAGELPVFRTGLFADRHQLADQAYGELLKRKPQAVKKPKSTVKAAGKSSSKSGKAAAAHEQVGEAADGPGFGKPGHLRSKADDKPDQIGPADPTRPLPEGIHPPDALPAIEGDNQLELEEAHG